MSELFSAKLPSGLAVGLTPLWQPAVRPHVEIRKETETHAFALRRRTGFRRTQARDDRAEFRPGGRLERDSRAVTEKAIKISEKLAGRDNQINEVSRGEFDDIAQSVALHRHQPQNN
jgi:hypothetical protein